MYVCTHVFMCVCVCVNMIQNEETEVKDVSMHACTCVRMYIGVCVCVNMIQKGETEVKDVSIHACTCVRMYIYMHGVSMTKVTVCVRVLQI